MNYKRIMAVALTAFAGMFLYCGDNVIKAPDDASGGNTGDKDGKKLDSISVLNQFVVSGSSGNFTWDYVKLPPNSKLPKSAANKFATLSLALGDINAKLSPTAEKASIQFGKNGTTLTGDAVLPGDWGSLTELRLFQAPKGKFDVSKAPAIITFDNSFKDAIETGAVTVNTAQAETVFGADHSTWPTGLKPDDTNRPTVDVTPTPDTDAPKIIGLTTTPKSDNKVEVAFTSNEPVTVAVYLLTVEVDDADDVSGTPAKSGTTAKTDWTGTSALTVDGVIADEYIVVLVTDTAGNKTVKSVKAPSEVPEIGTHNIVRYKDGAEVEVHVNFEESGYIIYWLNSSTKPGIAALIKGKGVATLNAEANFYVDLSASDEGSIWVVYADAAQARKAEANILEIPYKAFVAPALTKVDGGRTPAYGTTVVLNFTSNRDAGYAYYTGGANITDALPTGTTGWGQLDRVTAGANKITLENFHDGAATKIAVVVYYDGEFYGTSAGKALVYDIVAKQALGTLTGKVAIEPLTGSIVTKPNGVQLEAAYTGGANTETGTVSWQWKKDGVDITGATAATYTATAAGTYSVEYTREGYTPITSTAPAVIAGPAVPVITIGTQPATTTTVAEGAVSGSLSVSATVNPTAALTYQWYSNTTASATGGTAVTTGGTSTSFTIPASLTVGTYYYYVVVSSTGAVNVTSTVATVNVLAAGSTVPVSLSAVATAVENLTAPEFDGVVAAWITAAEAISVTGVSSVTASISPTPSGTRFEEDTYAVTLTLTPATTHEFGTVRTEFDANTAIKTKTVGSDGKLVLTLEYEVEDARATLDAVSLSAVATAVENLTAPGFGGVVADWITAAEAISVTGVSSVTASISPTPTGTQFEEDTYAVTLTLTPATTHEFGTVGTEFDANAAIKTKTVGSDGKLVLTLEYEVEDTRATLDAVSLSAVATAVENLTAPGFGGDVADWITAAEAISVTGVSSVTASIAPTPTSAQFEKDTYAVTLTLTPAATHEFGTVGTEFDANAAIKSKTVGSDGKLVLSLEYEVED